MNAVLIGLLLTITQGIYTLESSGGKHDSCTLQGQYNGYGYASNKICFESHAIAEAVVADWVQRHLLQGLTVNQTLCLYNTGKVSSDCEYARKFRSLK